MLDLTFVIIFKLLSWFSLLAGIISAILLLSLFILTSDTAKLPEHTVEAFIRLTLILFISLGIYTVLPSDSFLSKIEKGIYYKLSQEYKLPLKDKK